MLYHLEDIEKIREVEKEVSNNGYKVFDISHWDSGKDYNKLLLSSLEIQHITNHLNIYIITKSLPRFIH